MITAKCKESDLLGDVHTPKDFEALCALEQTHEIVIKTPVEVKRNQVFEVTIEVGAKQLHPNRHDHFIEWIELYSGNTFLFRINLSSSLSQPKVTIPIKLKNAVSTLRVWHKCNMHGIWEGMREIRVVP